MTTAKSPVSQLRAQAHKIAETLKRSAAGERIASDAANKIPISKERGYIDFAVVMDDKIIKIQIPWETIEGSSLSALCDFIFDQMQKEAA